MINIFLLIIPCNCVKCWVLRYFEDYSFEVTISKDLLYTTYTALFPETFTCIFVITMYVGKLVCLLRFLFTEVSTVFYTQGKRNGYYIDNKYLVYIVLPTLLNFNKYLLKRHKKWLSKSWLKECEFVRNKNWIILLYITVYIITSK